jgi:hypothetical protein
MSGKSVLRMLGRNFLTESWMDCWTSIELTTGAGRSLGLGVDACSVGEGTDMGPGKRRFEGGVLLVDSTQCV